MGLIKPKVTALKDAIGGGRGIRRSEVKGRFVLIFMKDDSLD